MDKQYKLIFKERYTTAKKRVAWVVLDLVDAETNEVVVENSKWFCPIRSSFPWCEYPEEGVFRLGHFITTDTEKYRTIWSKFFTKICRAFFTNTCPSPFPFIIKDEDR